MKLEPSINLAWIHGPYFYFWLNEKEIFGIHISMFSPRATFNFTLAILGTEICIRGWL